MIVIFLNELKNITISFMKTNYFTAVAKANLDKNCNNIYCQAETGSFSLAKNSFDILLSNDIFNTKSYYVMILFILILLFCKLFYDFVILNNEPNYGDDLLTINYILKKLVYYYPLVFIIISGILMTSMIAIRNTPNEKNGYNNYFNKHIKEIAASLYVFIVLNIIIYSILIYTIDENTDNIIINICFLILLNIYLYLIFNIFNIILTYKNEDIFDEDGVNVMNKDLSYYTTINFYKKYFNIIDKDYTTSSESCYNIDGYIVKNIGTLLIYIFVVFIIFFGIFFTIPENRDEKYNNNIIMPLFVFLIVILFMFLFVIFNTDYNKYVVYGVYNSLYKSKLNKLNNIVIPYIKLHETKANANSIMNNDFTEQYIITNIIASIVNNTLLMTSYNSQPIDFDCEDDDACLLKKLRDIKDIEYNKYFNEEDSKKLTNNFNRKDYDKFKEYYGIILKNRIGIEHVRSNTINNYITRITKDEKLSDLWDEFNIVEGVNEIPNIHLIDTYIDTYKYKYRFRIFKLIKICKIIFNDDNIFDEKYTELKQNFFYIGDEIQYKFLIDINSDKRFIEFITAYDKIDNKTDIDDSEKILDTPFLLDNFNSILSNDIEKNLYDGYEKYDEFNNYTVSHYAKVLFSLTNKQRKEHKDNETINKNYTKLKNSVNNNDKTIYSIIDNFLIISSHIAYNSIEYEKTNEAKVKDNDKMSLLNSRDKDLFGLIIDNTGENVYNKIKGNTFEYHITEHYYNKALEAYRIVIKVFTNTISIKNEVNFSNNYLKQIVSMIYKQINNEDVTFSNNIENKPISLSKNIETNENIENSKEANEILIKANYTVSIEFLFIYIFNLILMCLIFYIGKDLKKISFKIIKNILTKKVYNAYDSINFSNINIGF